MFDDVRQRSTMFDDVWSNGEGPAEAGGRQKRYVFGVRNSFEYFGKVFNTPQLPGKPGAGGFAPSGPSGPSPLDPH